MNPKELKLKYFTMLQTHINEINDSQEQIAKTLNVRQPKISRIKNGYIKEFSLENILYYLFCLGFLIEVKVNIKENK